MALISFRTSREQTTFTSGEFFPTLANSRNAVVLHSGWSVCPSGVTMSTQPVCTAHKKYTSYTREYEYMLDVGVNQLARYFVLGVVGLLLTISFNLFQDSIQETGDRYYRIPVLGNEFKGKRARQAVIIVVPLLGFVLMGVLQPRLVRIALGDMRVLSTLCGLLIGMILVASSAEPENWKIDDGRPLTHYAGIISALLVVGPWAGPWLANILIEFLTRQYNRLTAFLMIQLKNLITYVTEWIASHTVSLAIFALGIVLVGYALNREVD